MCSTLTLSKWLAWVLHDLACVGKYVIAITDEKFWWTGGFTSTAHLCSRLNCYQRPLYAFQPTKAVTWHRKWDYALVVGLTGRNPWPVDLTRFLSTIYSKSQWLYKLYTLKASWSIWVLWQSKRCRCLEWVHHLRELLCALMKFGELLLQDWGFFRKNVKCGLPCLVSQALEKKQKQKHQVVRSY